MKLSYCIVLQFVVPILYCRKNAWTEFTINTLYFIMLSNIRFQLLIILRDIESELGV